MPFKEPIFSFNELLLIRTSLKEYKNELNKDIDLTGLEEKLRQIFYLRLTQQSVHSEA